MSHIIAAVLNLLQPIDPHRQVLRIFQNVMQKAGALSQILGNVAEHAKEFCFAGNQSHPAIRLLRNFSCKIASTISLRLSERQISAVFVAYWEDF